MMCPAFEVGQLGFARFIGLSLFASGKLPDAPELCGRGRRSQQAVGAGHTGDGGADIGPAIGQGRGFLQDVLGSHGSGEQDAEACAAGLIES